MMSPSDWKQRLRNPKEPRYFILALVVSSLLLLAFVLSIVGIAYIIFFGLFFFFSQGIMIANLRGNAVRVTSVQFPDLYKTVETMSAKLGLAVVPQTYVLQSGGVLNAFATRFLRRDFLVLYSSILEMAYADGQEAVEFVVGHELGHVALGHVKKKMWTLPSMFVPFIGSAYSRACERSADNVGIFLSPGGAVKGLCVLAAGCRLSEHVDADTFADQTAQNCGFWEWLAEHLATHPFLANRVRAAQKTVGK
jgi:Zn-dependent protease with chaperone function